MSGEEIKEDLAYTIGRAARIARHRLKYTQETTALRVGISPEFYARIERGQAMPSVPTLVGIADALGATANDLLGTGDEPLDELRLPPEPPIEDKALRRAIRRVRIASPGARRLVAALVKLLEKKQRDAAE